MLRRIKQTVFGVGLVATGIFFFLAPAADLAEEIPWHQELGIGVALFGVLILLAVFVRAAMRLVQALIIGGLGAGFLFAAFQTPFADWDWQGYMLAGVGLLCAVNVPIALAGGYDFQRREKSSVGKDFAGGAVKRGVEDIFDD